MDTASVFMKPATTEIEPDTSRKVSDTTPTVPDTSGKVPDTSGVRHPAAELLAPAGSFEAALAAFQYGADAIYLGLSNLSARAEAVNFTPEQLLSITAYAHALSPRRAVYVAVNTLVRDDEVQGVLDALDACSEAGVDGVILQDFAVFTLLRRNFPNLKAHASTQMAVHNLEGAQAIAELGFSRVVLARELSFAEIRDITAKAPIETEVFIHGALCYGYSGLCLFSALRTRRSGNRGRCAYCCRSEYQPVEGRERAAFPFSMRDLFLYDSVRDLRDAGVASLKIEGRMKSAYYTAAVTNAYRHALDAAMAGRPLEKLWRDEVDMLSHRPYSTGFYFGQPGQYTDDARYESAADGVAVVETCEADTALLTQRNKFLRGDELELLVPGGDPVAFIASELYDADGLPIADVRRAMMPFRMPLPFRVPAGTVLRKRRETPAGA